jgi:hypothetical protein
MGCVAQEVKPKRAHTAPEDARRLQCIAWSQVAPCWRQGKLAGGGGGAEANWHDHGKIWKSFGYFDIAAGGRNASQDALVSFRFRTKHSCVRGPGVDCMATAHMPENQALEVRIWPEPCATSYHSIIAPKMLTKCSCIRARQAHLERGRL